FLLSADKHPPRILHRRRTLQGIFEDIQWQARVIDSGRRGGRNSIALHDLLPEWRNQFLMVARANQGFSTSGITSSVRLLALAKQDHLLESQTFRVRKAKDANSFKLAGQEPRTPTQHSNGNDKHQHALSHDPAEAMLKENELHSLVVVRPQFSIVGGIQV